MKYSRAPTHRSQRLAPFRSELQADHARLLVNLTESRDKLAHLHRVAGHRDLRELIVMRQLVLAFEIVIAIAERENFLSMPAERIAVVLRQLEIRLLRLGEMLRASQIDMPREAWRALRAERPMLVLN